MSSLQDQAELKVLRSLFIEVHAPQLIDDDRFSPSAKTALLQMVKGSSKERLTALTLIAAVKAGTLSGIREAEQGEVAAHFVSDERTNAFDAPIDKGPLLLFRTTEGDAAPAALSDAVRNLNERLKEQPQPTPMAGMGCLVYCGLCALVVVDEGATAFACLVCLTCAGDA